MFVLKMTAIWSSRHVSANRVSTNYAILFLRLSTLDESSSLPYEIAHNTTITKASMILLVGVRCSFVNIDHNVSRIETLT